MHGPDRDHWIETCVAELRKRRPHMHERTQKTVSESLWLVRGRLRHQSPAQAVCEWADLLAQRTLHQHSGDAAELYTNSHSPQNSG
jgi:hypothetical protein